MKPIRIFPIILAGGDSNRFVTPKPLAEFDGRTALELAVGNCEGMERPIVVLGHRAEGIRRRVPESARVAINRAWQRGQLSSLLAGLKLVPRGAAFLLYPVDQPLLTAALVSRLLRAFLKRGPGKSIVMPRKGARAGHPILCCGELRSELRRAQTAREVVYRDPQRIRYVLVRDAAIWTDFDSPATYRRCLRLFRRQQQKVAAPFAPPNSSRAAIPAESQSYRRQRRDHQR
jgi:CTP:molybdopterin cytidylyltransferase MocA